MALFKLLLIVYKSSTKTQTESMLSLSLSLFQSISVPQKGTGGKEKILDLRTVTPSGHGFPRNAKTKKKVLPLCVLPLWREEYDRAGAKERPKTYTRMQPEMSPVPCFPLNPASRFWFWPQ